MRYELSKDAKAELDDAFYYYEESTENLGLALLDEVYEVLERLLLFPESSPIVTGRMRKAILPVFPYKIIYSIQKDLIYVVAFVHQKENRTIG